ncbi:MAG: TetR/AcrR family transcriptional regulator [Ancrocorticia sp.]|nr:TetR/AcrR family transcriptional regulator [Ancrocorticia sp.]MCI2001738.1 TetR/AcrR family transcriptional regulator [Ancrocorticia sp.]MCI2013050.1 TetR/AcrR family transcriptional regulator [Ancrocorticia sp.]MCI2029573.1 TetR/AcrR family transcriptional regulator [Ancrocorticia sp.]MCI2178568.1 TetR/AcrR family transcriptional regulator [Ancrocorticia sp.]
MADLPRGKAQQDPRYLRVCDALSRAILELAAHKPAEAISVSELTNKAGIARATFYKHADSPAQFLADYLIDQIRPRFALLTTIFENSGADYLLRWRSVYIALLEHVAENAQVYSHVFTPSGQSVVLARLSAYFEEALGAYVREFVAHVDEPDVSELWIAMAISQQVHNIIAVVSAWLRTGMKDSPEVVINTYMSLAPPWQLAKFTASGHTSLRRTRALAELLASTPGAAQF